MGALKDLLVKSLRVTYSTENNTHASSFNTSLFFLLHPIIKKKKKALHILKISFGIFFHFVFRNAHIPRSSLHHSLVSQGAALGHPWLEVALNTLLTAGNILPHGEGRLQQHLQKAKQAFAFLQLYRQTKEHKSFLARIQLNVRPR